jgi:adenylate cyclase
MDYTNKWVKYKGREILFIDKENLENADYTSFLNRIEQEITENRAGTPVIVASDRTVHNHGSLQDRIRLLKESDHSDELFRLLMRRSIERLYAPSRLVDAIIEKGINPDDYFENTIGVGFIDIANYTFISKFLSTKENQTILNGLFSAFNLILKKHEGYLNKLEGDSMMIQFGGPIDSSANMENPEYDIASRLFYSCVEIQQVANWFNQADDRFFDTRCDDTTCRVMHEAFDIIKRVREDEETAISMSAYFQIRVRIGANIGTVCIGNLGPEDNRQWDVVGTPVITAKRMEATAPVGGLRISQELYDILDTTGIVDEYLAKTRRESQKNDGYCSSITREELFRFSTIILKDKRNARFDTYSVMVSHDLPETVARQLTSLILQGSPAIERIMDMIKYHRSNRMVVTAIEDIFHKFGIRLRRNEILKCLSPGHYMRLVNETSSETEAGKAINDRYKLFSLFQLLDKLQNRLNDESDKEDLQQLFTDYESHMKSMNGYYRTLYRRSEQSRRRRAIFYEVQFNLVFEHIRSSILEYQIHNSM